MMFLKKEKAMKKIVIFSASALLVLAMSGCVGKQSVSLERTGWKLVAWSISSMKADAFEITANFNDKTISGKSAVNSYNGPYSIESDNITFGPITSTKMAGTEDTSKAESNFFGLICQVRKLKVDGIRLTFMDENKKELLVFKMTSPPEI